MLIQFNSDNVISGHEGVAATVDEIVTSRLGRFAARLSRVEVHVADVNGPRGGGGDIRCNLEARPENGRPHAVTANGNTVDAAVREAAGKMQSLLDTEFGKQRTY